MKKATLGRCLSQSVLRETPWLLSTTASGASSAGSILERRLALPAFLKLLVGLLQVFKNLQQMGDGCPLLGQNLSTGSVRGTGVLLRVHLWSCVQATVLQQFQPELVPPQEQLAIYRLGLSVRIQWITPVSQGDC